MPPRPHTFSADNEKIPDKIQPGYVEYSSSRAILPPPPPPPPPHPPPPPPPLQNRLRGP
jgi:hypothetical protein